MMADPMFYDDGIIFDDDDPDFAPTEDKNYEWYRPDTLTLDQRSERPFGRLIRCRPTHRVSKGGLPRNKRVFDLAELRGELVEMEDNMITTQTEIIEDMLTLEHLRERLYSCLSCGVRWKDGQVSLDCNECGGYTMDRPCPMCDGACPSLWTRNLCKTHTFNRAFWDGSCRLYPDKDKLVVRLNQKCEQETSVRNHIHKRIHSNNPLVNPTP